MVMTSLVAGYFERSGRLVALQVGANGSDATATQWARSERTSGFAFRRAYGAFQREACLLMPRSQRHLGSEQQQKPEKQSPECHKRDTIAQLLPRPHANQRRCKGQQ